MAKNPEAELPERGRFVVCRPPPPQLRDDLRTVAQHSSKSREAALNPESFDAVAARILGILCWSAEHQTFGVAECDNRLTGQTGLVLYGAFGDSGLIRLAEMMEATEPGRLTDAARTSFHNLADLAENWRLVLVVHAPFAGHRHGAQAFATTVITDEGEPSWRYLARLFVYESEAAQWLGRGPEGR